MRRKNNGCLNTCQVRIAVAVEKPRFGWERKWDGIEAMMTEETKGQFKTGGRIRLMLDMLPFTIHFGSWQVLLFLPETRKAFVLNVFADGPCSDTT